MGFVTSAQVDWSQTASVIDYLVAYSRVLAGERRLFDETAVRDLVRRDVERAHDFAAVQNLTPSRTASDRDSRCRRSPCPPW